MTQKISERQAGIILFISIVSLKFLVLPALLYKFSANKCYVSVIIGVLIDLVFMLLIINVIKKLPNLTFNELIKRAYGKTISKILNFVMFVYFFLKGILLIKEMHNYFNETLFESINWNLFVIPLLLLIFYIMTKHLKVIARTTEFFIYLIFLGLILTLIMPIQNMDISNLFPLFNGDLLQIFNGIFRGNFSFGDYFVLIMLMGKIDNRNSNLKTIKNYIYFAFFAVINFFIIFVSIFGNIGINQSLAISDLPMFSSSTSAIGRLDWVVIILWVITLVLQIGILFSFANQCLKDCFSFKHKNVSALIILAMLFFLIASFYLNLAGILNIVTNTYFSIITVSIQLLLPILLYIAKYIIIKNNNIKTSLFCENAKIKIQYTTIQPVKIYNKFNLFKMRKT